MLIDRLRDYQTVFYCSFKNIFRFEYGFINLNFDNLNYLNPAEIYTDLKIKLRFCERQNLGKLGD